MKKIITFRLGIELTQRCNLNCSHCFRGESCNVNITREILEKIFDEVKYAYILDLSGGEVFLAYNELKMLLEIAKEKNTTFQYCSMITNGTIYDKRIYDLLNEYFGDNYQVAISNDDFHDKSIARIYSNNKEDSKNSDLYPLTLNDVKRNMLMHLDDSHSIGFQRVSNRLIENGRAINSDTPKKQYEISGYYYDFMSKNGLLVGPMIFIGADGYISDINSDILKREEQSIGNILQDLISESVIAGGINIHCNDAYDFFEKMEKREEAHLTHQGEHLIFKNNKMECTSYEPDDKYIEAMNKLPEDIALFREAILEGKVEEFIKNWDPIYDGDLSQIEHKKNLI